MIVIPQRLKSLIDRDRNATSVSALIVATSSMLDDNEMPFFPYYTDHGRQHVEQVLLTITKLIPEEVWAEDLLRPVDAVVLVCATLLHDMAMHLRESGFEELVRGDIRLQPNDWFARSHHRSVSDLPWHELWDAYTREANRFSDRDLNRLFGINPTDSLIKWRPRALPADSSEWNFYDRLLIGEFVRRHHARLAHEIANYGYPGLDDNTFPILGDVCPDISDLIGVIARSHGLPLRQCILYLQEVYSGDLRPRGCLAVYHMALLRVADYLQLDSSRAPNVLLQLRNPKVPVSAQEWSKHGAVAHVSFSLHDPQAVKVDVVLEHSLTVHLQLKQLLDDLQAELDTSAAVLSEVYGRVAEDQLQLLRLAKTRVTSNIYDPSLLDRLPYIPVHAAFDADPNLLTLLVEPLYSNSPEIGVRELIQNSIDAVLEAQQYRTNHSLEDEGRSQEPDVAVALEQRDDQNWYLRIADRGIGMNEEIIRGYFLTAGSSFRRSETWRREFADDFGHSSVLRSGRFGIGIFAAFLLGEKVEVRTRHIADKSGTGISFELSEYSNLIELVRKPAPYGTTITIKLPPSGVDRLLKSDWDWYTLAYPKVTRSIHYLNGKQEELPQKLRTPSPNSDAEQSEWRRFSPPGFDAVYWSHDSDIFLCNGLRIAEGTFTTRDATELTHGSHSWIWKDDEFARRFKKPSLSVFDSDGNLPLSLKRDRLSQRYLPFDPYLADDVLLDFCSFSLVCAPRIAIWQQDVARVPNTFSYPLLIGPQSRTRSNALWHPWFYMAEGCAPLIPELVRMNDVSRIVMCFDVGRHEIHWIPRGDIVSGTMFVFGSCDREYQKHRPGGQIEIGLPPVFEHLFDLGYVRDRCRILGCRISFAQANDRINVQIPLQNLPGRLKHRPSAEGFSDLVIGDYSQDSTDPFAILRSFDFRTSEFSVPVVVQLDIENTEDVSSFSPTSITNAWNTAFKQGLIPFDTDERDGLMQSLRDHGASAHLDQWSAHCASYET